MVTSDRLHATYLAARKSSRTDKRYKLRLKRLNCAAFLAFMREYGENQMELSL